MSPHLPEPETSRSGGEPQEGGGLAATLVWLAFMADSDGVIRDPEVAALIDAALEAPDD